MEDENGKIRLVLRSKRVARIAEFSSAGVSSSSLMSWHGPLATSGKKRVVVYDYVFDDKQKRALEEARSLAKRTGLALQVTDLSRQNAMERALRSSLGTVAGAVARLSLDLKALRRSRESGYEGTVR
jgi:hypothetical protein